MITLAVDCMGGDHGPTVTLEACRHFLTGHPEAHLLLVGLPQALQHFQHPRATLVAASEVVTMEDPLEIALRRKKDSSMRVAIEQVRDGKADAAVSAGNTGALMAIARYVLKTMEGIDRPAIAGQFPNAKGGATTMLDMGANVDCSPQHLLQFALMGTALVSVLNGDENPTVGLLNIGEEDIKGGENIRKTAELLRSAAKSGDLNFYGNVEGDDIFHGTVNIFTKSAGIIAYPALSGFKRLVDHRRHNGAALLGLRGLVFKSHGSADALAFEVALSRAYDAAHHQLLARVERRLAHAAPLLAAAMAAETIA